MKHAALSALPIACALFHTARVHAESSPVPEESKASAHVDAVPPPEAAAPPAPASPRPPPYSLPWQFRAAIPSNVVRADSAIAFYDDAASNGGTTIASTLFASYKVLPDLAPLVRLAFVQNTPPSGDSAASFVNPIVGANYGVKLSPELRLAFFLGFAIPVGQGGGNSPDAAQATATKSGIYARSALDNALFAVNDFVVIPGADLAWISHGFTVQVEATVLQLTRVRGADVQPDSAKTNLVTGIHVGFFPIPALSIGAELRHQRWLSTPAMVEKDERLRDATTLAIGPRLHFQLDRSLWFRPGIAYARGLDAPMTTGHYNIVQVDLALAF